MVDSKMNSQQKRDANANAVDSLLPSSNEKSSAPLVHVSFVGSAITSYRQLQFCFILRILLLRATKRIRFLPTYFRRNK